MEPDEKIIQRKIRTAELTPAVWDKEMVWASLNKSKKANSRRLVFYYTAAALMLAFALVFYSVQQTKRTELDLRIKSLELSISQNSEAARKITDQPNEICFDTLLAIKPKKVFAISNKKPSTTTDTLFQKTSAVNKLENDSLPIASQVTLDIKSGPKTPALVEKSNPQKPSKVEPIIAGYFLPSENQKEKTFRVFFIAPQEQKKIQEFEREPFLVAKIN